MSENVIFLSATIASGENMEIHTLEDTILIYHLQAKSGSASEESILLSTAVANSSKVASSKQIWSNIIHTMVFLSFEDFSVTYLELYLARKCEIRQTCPTTGDLLIKRS